MQSLRTVHRELILEATVDSVFKILRNAILRSEDYDVHDIAQTIVEKDASLKPFSDALVADYNEYIKSNKGSNDSFYFVGKNLHKLSFSQINKGAEALKAELSNVVTDIDIDAIIDAVASRLSKFTHVQLQEALSDSDGDYGGTMSLFVRRVARYVMNRDNDSYLSARHQLLMWTESNPDETSFESDILNNIERSLAKFEKIATSIDATVTPGSVTFDLAAEFADVQKKYTAEFSFQLSRQGYHNLASIVQAIDGSSDVLAKTLADNSSRSIKNMITNAKRIVNTWNEWKDAIVAMVDKTPTDEQKKVILGVASAARLLAKSPLAQSIVSMQVINYRVSDIIRQIAEDDPEVGEGSLERILNVVLSTSFAGQPVSLQGVEKAIKEITNVSKNMEEFKDPEFRDAMDKIIELLSTANSAGFYIRDVEDKVLNDMGPKGVDKSMMFRSMLASLSHGLKQGMSTETFMNNISSGHYSDKVDAYHTMYAMLEPWRAASDEERSSLVNKVKKMVELSLVKAAERDVFLRKKNPPEVKKGAKFRPLDDYAFGDARIGKVPSEKDNEKERILYKALRRHFSDNIPLSKSEAEEITKILDNDAYSKIFHKPKTTWLFRGQGASERWLRKALKIKEGEPLPKTGSKSAAFTYTPRGDVAGSSWSVSTKTATNFKGEDDEYNIVMQASNARNPNKFVAGPDGLYDVPGLDDYGSEKESIGLGPIKVSKVYWAKAVTKGTSVTGLPKDKVSAPKKSSPKKKLTKKPTAKKATKK